MAAALMAVEHFNTRNNTVVPELADLDGCNVRLKLGNTSFFDTGSLTQLASQRLFSREEVPCAIAGPFSDLPAGELSVMAQAAKFPMVAHRAYNYRTTSNFFSSYTSQVYPHVLSSTRNLVSFLQHKGRTNYIALLYALSDVNFQRRETLSFELDNSNIKWTSSTYIPPLSSGSFTTETRSAITALKHLKKSGYRTIVVAMDSAWGELQAIADAAEALGMNEGDYFWVWYDVFEPAIPFFGNNNISKIVSGSVWMLPLENALLDPDADPFATSWNSQGKEEIDRLNTVNPISPNKPGYKFAEDGFFQSVRPEYGSSEFTAWHQFFPCETEQPRLT